MGLVSCYTKTADESNRGMTVSEELKKKRMLKQPCMVMDHAGLLFSIRVEGLFRKIRMRIRRFSVSYMQHISQYSSLSVTSAFCIIQTDLKSDESPAEASLPFLTGIKEKRRNCLE